ncbi:DUF1194 domain-containing protein [Marivivens marinus]|uniref:DUF1194 domain-containing protein n=1 Tax=Marivivens marinus TaxID=3110173 RepID=UPI003B848AB9
MKATAIALALFAATPADAACRQALALGLDVSGSVDAREYRLQLDGLAAALTAPEVVEALLGDGGAPVRITVYEWSGPNYQRIILPWSDLSDPVAIADAATVLRGHPRPAGQPVTTALGAAVETGIGLLRGQGDCWRHTLDISGDGKSNTGVRPQDIPDAALPPSMVVNALVIGADADIYAGDPRSEEIQELSAYFQSYVIRGPGAFIETALGFDDYEAAMRRKLIRELQTIAIGMAPLP